MVLALMSREALWIEEVVIGSARVLVVVVRTDSLQMLWVPRQEAVCLKGARWETEEQRRVTLRRASLATVAL